MSSDYTNSMDGIDRVDQHIASYLVIKKQGKKYYYYDIFIYLLDQQYETPLFKIEGSKSHLQFRLDLIEVTGKYGIMKYQPGCPSLTSVPSHLVGRHFIENTTHKKRVGQRDNMTCVVQKKMIM